MRPETPNYGPCAPRRHPLFEQVPRARTSHPGAPQAVADSLFVPAGIDEDAVGKVVIGADGRLVEYDAQVARMLRVPTGEDLRGADVRRFFRHPAQVDETLHAIQMTGSLENWDGDFVACDGSSLHAVVNLIGDFDEARTLVALRASLFNITEWHRVHERKLLAQRFETIGRLAGGIAHDFNNLLTVISGHAECLAMVSNADPSLQRSVAAIRESAARGAALTQRLLAFGRRQVLLPRVVNPGDLVLTVEGDLRRTFGRRIAVGVDLEPAVRSVRVDPEQTERALGTIASHAIDAMPQGGAITFRTRNVDVDADFPQTRSFIVAAGRYVAIETVCAGMTLDEKRQNRIFEPFQTPKGGGRDQWGLSAVFGLVKQSGGYIWLDSEPAQTVFTVLLAADQDMVAPSPPAPRAKSPTILVVDDDEEVRGLLVSILKHEGYTVLDAASAEHGSRLCNSSEINLLISDVALGGVRGDEFAASLMATRPDLKLVCISGYPEPNMLRALDPHRAVFQGKPFSARQLADQVGTLLRH